MLSLRSCLLFSASTVSFASDSSLRVAVRGVPFVPSHLVERGAKIVQESEDWDILWAQNHVDQVPDGKLVNFVPGLGALTNKTTLAALAKEQEWTFTPPLIGTGLRVAKDPNHGGVRILDADAKDGGLQQSLIERPLLIDGVKFDLGVFALYYVDSANKLRAAVYTRDVLMRAATAPYPEVITPESAGVLVPSIDAYKPFWELPSLEKFGTAKAALESTIGMDDLWPQVEAIVSSTLPAVRSKTVPFGVMQLVRFDLLLNEARKLWLIEINQSPRVHVPRAPRDEAWRVDLANDIATYVFQRVKGKETEPSAPWRVVSGAQATVAEQTPALRSLSESESESESSTTSNSTNGTQAQVASETASHAATHGTFGALMVALHLMMLRQ